MGLLSDFSDTFRRPGVVVVRKLANGIGEEQVLAYVMLSSVLTFIGRIPALLRDYAALTENVPELGTFIGGNMTASILFVPLFLYLLAAISHAIAMAFGGKGSWFSARLALFWSLLVMQPLVLIQGYLVSLYAPPQVAFLSSILIGMLFFLVWIFNLIAVEQGPKEQNLP